MEFSLLYFLKKITGKHPITNEIRQMTKEELISGRMLLYFNPKDVIRQIEINPSTFRAFLLFLQNINF